MNETTNWFFLEKKKYENNPAFRNFVEMNIDILRNKILTIDDLRSGLFYSIELFKRSKYELLKDMSDM